MCLPKSDIELIKQHRQIINSLLKTLIKNDNGKRI